jgi:hypothetical protein
VLTALAAAAALTFLLAVQLWQSAPSSLPSATWSVTSIAGAPQIAASAFQGQAGLSVGQWLETDPTSRAKLSVGQIGEVEIAPNSRVRLVTATDTDHRLELAHGTLHALIWAPPRLFFVETPSATAIDLGCAYTLTVDDAGAGLLEVTAGYVALEHDGRESIVPAGARCMTRRHAPPGTPFLADASPDLRRALERFDFENAPPDALSVIVTEARVADAITLWHLLTRTTADDCARVFDALARLRPPPSGVTRAGILTREKSMLALWAADLGLTGWSELYQSQL